MKRSFVLGALILLGASAGVFAEPILQLYLEGATYDSSTETWIADGDLGTLRLWVIAQSPVQDVKLAVAYASSETPIINFTGSTTGGYGGFTDPSTASPATYSQTGADGSLPLLGDGTPLAPHGVYGPGTAWQEFDLGNFTLLDSPIADFVNSFPSPGAKSGQISVYEVSVTGASTVHFDAYDHVDGSNHVKYVFAPFSHDGGTGTVPAPGAVLLGVIGIGTIGAVRRRLLVA